jgi:hypothetical protein
MVESGAARHLWRARVYAGFNRSWADSAPISDTGHDQGQARWRRDLRGAGHGQCAAYVAAAGGTRIGIRGMLTIPPCACILLAAWPVNLRKGAHGLAVLAAEVLGKDRYDTPRACLDPFSA